MVNIDRSVSICEIEKQKKYMAKIRSANDAYFEDKGVRRKAFALTLGCQQNEADSERLMGMAVEMGYEKCDDPDEASLIMVNTCAIREHAEKRALSLVGQYKHIKNRNPDLMIVICGCMVVQEHRVKDIKMRYPYVDILFGLAAEHYWHLCSKGIRTNNRCTFNYASVIFRKIKASSALRAYARNNTW